MLDEETPAIEFEVKRRKEAPSGVKIVREKQKPTLNVDAFVRSLDSALSSQTVGHVMQLNQNGTPIWFTAVGWAQTPSDLGKKWTADTRMHVASVSKLLTAMGMMKALGKGGWNTNAHIAPFLPEYWHQGSNVNLITFHHLLRHRSGFKVPGSKTDFLTMKKEVAAGVSNVGESSGYENVNFGLMRILLPVMNGDIDRDMEVGGGGSINDGAWDALCVGFYRDYMQDHVFEPAGVNGAGFVPLPAAANGAVAYAFPNVGEHGWNSGDTSTVAGGAGWRLSIKELMSVLHHFRRKGTIVSTTTAQSMLDNLYGLNGSKDTDVGTIYWKKGGWHHGRRKEQCVAFFLPDGMELAVFANSTIGVDDAKIDSLVVEHFVDAIG